MNIHSFNLIKKQSNLVKNILKKQKNIGLVIPRKYLQTTPYIFDFSKKNKKLSTVDLNEAKEFINYVNESLKKSNSKFGAGGYGENRIIYRRSNLFKNDAEPRSIHLAIDLWLSAKNPVSSPLEATVHSFQDNNNFGDYGPTIILEHQLENIVFYTLYGHLSRSSLKKLKVGMKIKKGQQIATLGNYRENGNWPAHLHFQIISNMLGKKGDFPGVIEPSKKKYYLALCPDPNLILRLDPPHNCEVLPHNIEPSSGRIV